MAQNADAAQIDLGFGDTACHLLHFRGGIRSNNLPRERRNFLRERGIRNQEAGLAHGGAHFSPSGRCP